MSWQLWVVLAIVAVVWIIVNEQRGTNVVLRRQRRFTRDQDR